MSYKKLRLTSNDSATDSSAATPADRVPTEASRRFGREKAVSQLFGISLAKLRRDRWAGTGFPFYRHGSVVLYDIDECLSIIESSRRTSTSDSGAAR